MKSKLCWMTVCLLVASSGVITQAQNSISSSLNKDKSTFQKFIERTARAQHHSRSLKVADNDLLTGIEVSFMSEGVWFTGTKIEMDYDNGKMVSQEVLSLDDEEWVTHELTTKEYQNGLLKQETHQEIDFVTGGLQFYERYTYDYTTGIISEVIYEDWEGDEWIVGYKDEFTVVGGKITEATTLYWENEEWVPTEYYTFEIENDTLIATTQISDNMGGWVNYGRELYPNLTLEELYQVELNILESIQFSMLTSFIQYPDYLSQEWDGEKWVNFELQYTTIYNTPNQALDTKFVNALSWEDDEWKPYLSLVQYYNGKTLADSTILSFFTYTGAETEEWVVYTKENYIYNSAGLFDEIVSTIYPFQGMNLYKYKFEWNGISTGTEKPEKPVSFRLNPAYPNPFNPTTSITYSMEKAGNVRINVYDMLGRFITTLINTSQIAGEHRVLFNADNLASGIYIVRMEADGYQKNQLITLLK
ncbi:T9SS type A sorting domain-containing protein [Gracilimonas sp.]|uniref:T9SS type A sorting domain-containing protein n=1 Tax=Gracilimonas sp. TaxID=1974203 RepID=UPI0032EB3E35